MPTYDIECHAGHEHEIRTSWDDRQYPCPTCGEPTVRVWRGRAPAAHDDELPGGARFVENMGDQPVWIETKTQFARECKRHGVEPFVRHQGGPHGDKSKFTTRWF